MTANSLESFSPGAGEEDQHRPIAERLPLWGIWIVYALTILLLSYHHELWRDEVRALTIARESTSLSDLFANLHNEGHPALWYLILHAGAKLTRSVLVLRIASLAIALTAAAVLLRWAPFKALYKLLFLFGALPLYEYSVMCRNYGLSMLLLFLLASQYPNRFTRPIRVALILGALAHSNAPSTIIALAVLISLGAEHLAISRKTTAPRDPKILLSFLFVGFAIAVVMAQLYPDETTVVASIRSTDVTTLLKVAAKAVIHPGRHYEDIFGVHSATFLSVMIWLALIYLLRRPYLWIITFCSSVGLSMFFSLVHPAYLQHQGLLFLLLIVVYWLDITAPSPEEKTRLFAQQLERHKATVLLLLLVLQVSLGLPLAVRDIRGDMSSARALANYLKGQNDLTRAIVIGEPDYFMESLRYYAANDIYLPRERRFGAVVKFTTANKSRLSLADLTRAAREVKATQGRPVLIAMGHSLNADGPFELPLVYGKAFVYTRESLEEWIANTIRLHDFRSQGDENYTLYLLR